MKLLIKMDIPTFLQNYLHSIQKQAVLQNLNL